ncbi:MAG TPA: hypothetical protein VIK06_01470 [Candidatus Limnocylindrales bacterium]
MALVREITDLEELRRPVALPAPMRIRRCTYRRLSRVSAGAEAAYEVSCLYPDRRLPLPLGDMASSLPICADCSAGHIFRPDED